ncbi:MAG: aspartate-semialdehyde dehydrogenase [Bdellovibrionales bacterium]|nr:aspartate-semialdehyde dehydrogenase [Bdellovibrionales bacterium]
MNLGIVGATGLVGKTFLSLLEKEKTFPINELRLFSRSLSPCFVLGRNLSTQSLSPLAFEGLDICFFSAGEEVSRKWAPVAVEKGVIVIDNSSAFRLDSDKLLIVPEVNAHLLSRKAQIISNPNCSTIQLVVALQALEKSFGLQSVQVISLQSISGAGRQALESLKQESLDILQEKTSYKTEKISHAFNCIPSIGSLTKGSFCKEEMKIMSESKKILNRPDLKISAFTVRVPCLNSHSEVVRFSVKKTASLQELEDSLMKYVRVLSPYPHARQADQEKEVFVGRIHKDPCEKNSWWMWIVSDNLLKGASWNGLQIAQELAKIINK